MKLWVLAVGRPGRPLVEAIAGYEERARRYWDFEGVTVREEKAARGRPAREIRAAEAERLMQRIPAGAQVMALTRDGEAWSSMRLAAYLQDLGSGGRSGVAFLIGGAFGLGESVLRRADRRLSLSAFTLPHDLARLVLAEQLYRAGTIVRGEPYHKASNA
ncbi:MAG: 23S rRNA (pseudouridine(1915)-N(3))-methyltransferase RlmH [Gemmatimonadetes bacterium]|nr:23S rRNA (pseudouridine(1915)-N(3))-methyltransferase RlmH [Gemmatimonadota bacterium]